jgi:predicted transcriptional regulator
MLRVRRDGRPAREDRGKPGGPRFLLSTYLYNGEIMLQLLMNKKTSKKNRELPVSEEAFGKITALTDIYNSRLTIEQEEIAIELNVEVARSRGATWQELGEVLGISRSAAQKRFGSYLDEAIRPLQQMLVQQIKEAERAMEPVRQMITQQLKEAERAIRPLQHDLANRFEAAKKAAKKNLGKDKDTDEVEVED